MAFPHKLSLSPKPFPLFPFPYLTFKPSKLTFKFTPPSSQSSPDQAILESMAQAQGSNSLPCVRSYENDMARLSLAGSVAFDNALTAAAADGGEAAGQHLKVGLSTMVVETMFPGRDDEHSTVSTRLFLPANTVKEKARKLRNSLPGDILSSTNSTNILAMTFRQVVLQQLWNFELAIFMPGSQRNMEDLERQREQVNASVGLSSSDEKVIFGLAETVCTLALETTQREFFHGSSRKASNGLFNWLSRTNEFVSKDSSVLIYRFEDELVETAKLLLDKFNSVKSKYKVVKKKQITSGLPSLVHSTLEKLGGSEFSIWASEYVPAYRLEIDADRLNDLKFEGWKRSMGNRWEVLLTHSQMVGLANTLDMYFEDVYTLPYKQLSCNVVRKPSTLLMSKRGFSLLGFLRTTLLTATILLSVGVMIKICLPNSTRRKDHGKYLLLSSPKSTLLALEPLKLQAFCTTVVEKIKDYYDWHGAINYESSVGAWIGELPSYLRNGNEADSSGRESISAGVNVLSTSNEELKSSVQDIASYQVVLSSDGRIVGFQPTSGVAVNHWSANPLAKELYGGKILSPGLFEPGLKISKPGMPFFAALKLPTNCETTESALPEGFLDRIKGRGIIHGGWVQQQLILQHPSVGCFLTHCGAGSLSEGMVSDCQLVMLPQAVDQFINARLMSLDLRIGVEVKGRDKDGFFTREAVREAVLTVMDRESEIAKEVRANHAKWREFLRQEGLEESYIGDFVQNLQDIMV